MDKKVSVVVPTYRRPDLLKKCIDALMAQHFSKDEYEVIVVSDGPDEATASLLERYGRQVNLMPLSKKGGPAAARNYGWKHAKGQLIAFTDDDTLPDPDWLSTLWHSFNGEELVAYTGRVIVPLPDRPTDFELNTNGLERAEFITANCAVTRRALIETGGFDERFFMAWREDSDLHFKLLTKGIPIYKTEALVVHPVRKAPFGVSMKEQKKGIFNALLYKKFPHLYKERIKSKAPLNYYLIVLSFFGLLVCILSSKWQATLSFLILFLVLVLSFAYRRLRGTSHSGRHITEMIVTSFAIPFLSVYWQFYGAFKYRVLFI